MICWNESEIILDRKSKFQGRCCAIRDQEEIPSLLQQLVDQNKAVSKASHKHMYAWRTGDVSIQDKKSTKKKKNEPKQTDKVANLQQGFSDCGEAGAGQRLLTLLERANVINVLVIVTRWYGGTPLGSSRFRHISTAAVKSLKLGHFLP